MERLALDHVGGPTAGVLHQDDPGDLAVGNDVLVEVAHLRARQRGSHRALRSSTTTAAAIPASCEIVTCHLSAPNFCAIASALPRSSSRGRPLSARLTSTSC